MPSIFRSRTALSVLKFLSQHHSCVVTKLWELFSNLKQVHSCSILLRCVTVGLYMRAEVHVWGVWAQLQTVLHPHKCSRRSVTVLGNIQDEIIKIVCQCLQEITFFPSVWYKYMMKKAAFLSWAPITDSKL